MRDDTALRNSAESFQVSVDQILKREVALVWLLIGEVGLAQKQMVVVPLEWLLTVGVLIQLQMVVVPLEWLLTVGVLIQLQVVVVPLEWLLIAVERPHLIALTILEHYLISPDVLVQEAELIFPEEKGTADEWAEEITIEDLPHSPSTL